MTDPDFPAELIERIASSDGVRDAATWAAGTVDDEARRLYREFLRTVLRASGHADLVAAVRGLLLFMPPSGDARVDEALMAADAALRKAAGHD